MMNLKRLMLTTAILAAGTMPASAQQFNLTPFAGGAFFLSDLSGTTELEDSWTVGAHLGVTGPRGLGLRGTFAYVPSETTGSFMAGGGIEQNVFLYGGALTFHLPVQSRAAPYVVAGLGAKTYDPDVEGAESETDLMWNVGAGLEVNVGERLAFQLEATDYMSNFDAGIAGIDDELQHDLLVTLGVALRLGGRR